MNGILYGEILVEQLSVLLGIYGFLHGIYPSSESEELQKEDSENQTNKKMKIKDKVRIVVMLGTISLLMYWIGYLIINNNMRIAIYLIVALGIMFGAIVFILSIIDFIRYIFLKPFDYELTKDREGTLWLIGFFSCCVCYAIAVEDMGIWIEQQILYMTDYQADIIKIIVLIFWYFSIIFFSLTFFILSLHKFIKIYRSRKKTNTYKQIKKEHRAEIKKQMISELIWNRIEEASPKLIWEKIFFYMLWILSQIYETVKFVSIAIIEMIRDLMVIMLMIFPNMTLSLIKKLVDNLEKNQGKGIILSSRISLVSSLLLVYLVDKYQKIFSVAGSEVYEFLCSVIIIPFLITQLNSLRKMKSN